MTEREGLFGLFAPPLGREEQDVVNMWRIELMDWLCFIGSIGVVVVIVGALFGIGLAMFGSGVASMGSGEKAKGGESNV